jgi:hypothetical protein
MITAKMIENLNKALAKEKQEAEQAEKERASKEYFNKSLCFSFHNLPTPSLRKEPGLYKPVCIDIVPSDKSPDYSRGIGL